MFRPQCVKQPYMMTYHTLRTCHTFPGRPHGLFVFIDFPARRKVSAGKPIISKFCVYFPSRMRGTCVSVASVLRGVRVTTENGAWKLRIRYGQHTCTARYGRANKVVKARQLRARCEGTWTYEKERFFRYRETIHQCCEIEMITGCCKNLFWFTDFGNCLAILEINFRYR